MNKKKTVNISIKPRQMIELDNELNELYINI